MPTDTIMLPRDALLGAAAVLEAQGFKVETPPPWMLATGVMLTAYNAATGDGYLLAQAEVRLLAHYGTLQVLDPDWQASKPRWARDNATNREAKYVEAALANAVQDVLGAGQGNRNNVLNRVAYGLGRLAHLGLDRERAVQELLKAAMRIGLLAGEAVTTINSAWHKGSQAPKELPPAFGSPGGFGSLGSSPNISLSQTQKTYLVHSPPRSMVERLPWRKGGGDGEDTGY